MAKNKKKSQPQQKPSLSPDLYMRRVMRTLPIEKCYVNIDWREQGMAHVVIARRRPDGKFAVVNYLVDTYCLGVKDALWHTRMEEHELESYIDMLSERIDLAECDYATVHNLILGAVEFAQEGGIEPCREWAVGQYGLDEDSDDIDLIEFDYGRDGRHFLNTQTRAEGAKYLPILRAHLGDNFDYQFEDEVDNAGDYGGWEDLFDDSDEVRFIPSDTEFPADLQLRHPEVGEILLDKANEETVPVEQMARIAAIDRRDLVADLRQLSLYIIGRDCEESYGSLFHVAVILNTLGDPRGLDTLLEILRMRQDDLDYYFGDIAPNVLSSALYHCSHGRLDSIEAFLNEPGRRWYSRSIALDALWLAYADAPEAVAAIVRRQLESLPDRVDELVSADYMYAGFVGSIAMKIGDRSMLPLIKVLYDNDQIDPTQCGPYEHVERDFGKDFTKDEPMSMTDIYRLVRSFNEEHRGSATPDYEHLWA